MKRTTLQQIYERHYSEESTQQLRVANLLSDLWAWCKANGYFMDRVILEAATEISFPLGTSRTTPSMMWMDENVVFPDDPIPVAAGILRRATVADSILDSYELDRRLALNTIVADVLSSLQHRPPDFYDCVEIADQIHEKLMQCD